MITYAILYCCDTKYNLGLCVFMPKFANLSQQYNETSIIMVYNRMISNLLGCNLISVHVVTVQSLDLIVQHMTTFIFTLLTAFRILHVWHD